MREEKHISDILFNWFMMALLVLTTVVCIFLLSVIFGFVMPPLKVIHDFRNYFVILRKKHTKLLLRHRSVVSWKTTNQETKVWVRSTPVSLPSSLFGYPTTIILQQASKEPYRGSSEEVIIQRNKHNFFQKVWYGFMHRMAKRV